MSLAPPPESMGLSEATKKALDLHRKRVSETLKQLEVSMPAWLAKVKTL